MLDQTLTLPEDPEELRSFTARLLAGVKAQAILIEKLRHQLAGHRAHRFGASSETAEQLQLALETSEIAAAAMTARMKLPDIEEKDKPKRRPIPDHIPRMDVELTPGAGACADCGGRLRRIGEDVTEELEYVPGRFIVNRIVRPRLACACCERFVQAPLPSRPIERGRPGPGLLAHVLVSKSEGIVAPVGPRKPRRRRPSSLVSPEPDLRPRRARPGSLHAGRLGRQEHRAAGTARRCHRAACAGRTGDLRGR
jgi:transposase